LVEHGRTRFLGLGAALVASGVLVVVPPAPPHRPPVAPVAAAVAWPTAQRGTIAADLPDGTAYEPEVFIDARTSIGTAPSRDGRWLRLVLRHADASIREIRRLPLGANPSIQPVTVAGDVLAWAEASKTEPLQLWVCNLRDGRPARRLTADTGDARFYHSQYDLVVAAGRLHWVAAGPGDVTEVRSVALGGGAVQVRTEPGSWKFSAWPWLVNGVTAAVGATALRNLVTGRDIAVPSTRKGATDCGPTWCRVAELTADGSTRIDLMHPDGSAREHIGGSTAETEIVDVAPLDRFEVLGQFDGNSELTGNVQLVVFEIATRRTVEVSPDAGSIVYRNGVLWWSTGNRETFVRHALDLRTV
jgi:hypothetical protein